jgi:hypothetical protein
MVFDEWVHERLDRRFVRRRPRFAEGIAEPVPALGAAGVEAPRERGAIGDLATAIVLGVADAVTIWAVRLTR